MKTILVDAVNAFVIEKHDGFEIYQEMHQLLETFPNRKLIITGAPYEKFGEYRLDQVPYEVFTLQHNPPKTDPEYFRQLLAHFELAADDVVYFEHNPETVKSAETVGINSYYYDQVVHDLSALQKFLTDNA